MHLLFASSRINITILDEQQLEGLHVVAFLMGSQDEITCAPLTILNGEEKYIPSCQQKVFLRKHTYSIFPLLLTIHFSIMDELEDICCASTSSLTYLCCFLK